MKKKINFGCAVYKTNSNCFLFGTRLKLFPLDGLKTMTMPPGFAWRHSLVLRSSWGNDLTHAPHATYMLVQQ